MGCEPDKHRWEWAREREGVIEFRCMNENCGETKEQYVDTGSGC
jgi:hypothetical protein